jgi:hypothetical protein
MDRCGGISIVGIQIYTGKRAPMVTIHNAIHVEHGDTLNMYRFSQLSHPTALAGGKSQHAMISWVRFARCTRAVYTTALRSHLLSRAFVAGNP